MAHSIRPAFSGSSNTGFLTRACHAVSRARRSGRGGPSPGISDSRGGNNPALSCATVLSGERAGTGRRECLVMEFQDKMLKCIDCGADFVFTAGEQLFFHDKQFRNEPKRCKACKSKRVSVLGAIPSLPRNGYSKVETRATCSQCGKDTTVPFKPTQGRPVFCRECFQQRRQAATA